MLSRIILLLFALASPACQATNPTETNQSTTPDASLRRRERELAADLRWQVLWHDGPQTLRVPVDGKARLAAYQAGDLLSVCSHDLGICAQYQLNDRRLGHCLRMIEFDGAEDNKNAVLKFAGAPPLRLGPPTVVGTLGGVSGSPPPGLLWAPTIELHTREETIRQYQQLRPTTFEKVRNWLLNKQPDPTALEGLRSWLLKTHKEAGYRSLTIACFTPSDPTVFIYGDRPPERGGEIVFQVFWESEREEWVFAAMLEREQGAEIFADLKATVLATACDTISF